MFNCSYIGTLLMNSNDSNIIIDSTYRMASLDAMISSMVEAKSWRTLRLATNEHEVVGTLGILGFFCLLPTDRLEVAGAVAPLLRDRFRFDDDGGGGGNGACMGAGVCKYCDGTALLFNTIRWLCSS